MKRLLARLLGRQPIGLQQLLHGRARLVAAIGGVTFANVLIFMQLGFRGALFETGVMAHRSLDADVVLASSDFRSLREVTPFPRVRMFQALGDPAVERATPVYIATLMWPDPATGEATNFRVLGVDPRAEVFVDPVRQAALAQLTEPDTALVDTRTRGLAGEVLDAMARDERFTFEALGRRLTLVGSFEQGASFEVDGTLIVSDQTFLRLFPGRGAGTPSLALLKVGEGAPEEVLRSIAARVEAAMPEADARAFSKLAFVAAEKAYQNMQTPIGFVFGFGVAMGFVVGLVIVYQVLSTDVQDHLAEYATFKAIGYAPRYFLGVVLEEALALAALGFVPGIAISTALYALASSATALPISMPWHRPLFVFALTVTMCVVSGAIATRRLRAADPAELF